MFFFRNQQVGKGAVHLLVREKQVEQTSQMDEGFDAPVGIEHAAYEYHFLDHLRSSPVQCLHHDAPKRQGNEVGLCDVFDVQDSQDVITDDIEIVAVVRRRQVLGLAVVSQVDEQQVEVCLEGVHLKVPGLDAATGAMEEDDPLGGRIFFVEGIVEDICHRESTIHRDLGFNSYE